MTPPLNLSIFAAEKTISAMMIHAQAFMTYPAYFTFGTLHEPSTCFFGGETLFPHHHQLCPAAPSSAFPLPHSPPPHQPHPTTTTQPLHTRYTPPNQAPLHTNDPNKNKTCSVSSATRSSTLPSCSPARGSSSTGPTGNRRLRRKKSGP